MLHFGIQFLELIVLFVIWLLYYNLVIDIDTLGVNVLFPLSFKVVSLHLKAQESLSS